ncbi:MAG: cytochrome C [Myxococcales bacterium]|nr:cytochrome C [Myxococcales bacterium]
MKALLIAIGLLLLALPARADSYQEHDYILNCSGCHRMDGTGSKNVPSLHAMAELRGKPGARAYWAQVPGAAQAPLNDARLAALLNWLVQRFTGHSPSPLYTEGQVKRLRRTPLTDPVARRVEIRDAIPR